MGISLDIFAATDRAVNGKGVRNGTLIDTLFMQQLSQKWILILGLAYIMCEWKAPIVIDDWVNFSTHKISMA